MSRVVDESFDWAMIYRPESIDSPPGKVFAVIGPTTDPRALLHLPLQEAHEQCDKWNDRLVRERTKARANRERQEVFA